MQAVMSCDRHMHLNALPFDKHYPIQTVLFNTMTKKPFVIWSLVNYKTPTWLLALNVFMSGVCQTLEVTGATVQRSYESSTDCYIILRYMNTSQAFQTRHAGIRTYLKAIHKSVHLG